MTMNQFEQAKVMQGFFEQSREREGEIHKEHAVRQERLHGQTINAMHETQRLSMAPSTTTMGVQKLGLDPEPSPEDYKGMSEAAHKRSLQLREESRAYEEKDTDTEEDAQFKKKRRISLLTAAKNKEAESDKHWDSYMSEMSR